MAGLAGQSSDRYRRLGEEDREVEKRVDLVVMVDEMRVRLRVLKGDFDGERRS